MQIHTTDKPFNITKKQVYEAYKAVKSNAGSAGVDGQTIEQFDSDLRNNLYKLWNRMSSGSYFPPPVRAVSIPKKTAGQRILGVPTVADRVAQMVVKQLIEPDLDPIFLADSYGYRPRKSAHDAIGVTHKRCWKYDWVLEFDIKGLFDNIDHELLLRAVRRHVTCKWAALLYIERWLTAPMEHAEGLKAERTRGTPERGVVSPILANLFLHYTFDLWMTRTHPDLPWCRYADDGLVHCRNEQEAQALKAELQARLAECRLEMHPPRSLSVFRCEGVAAGPATAKPTAEAVVGAVQTDPEGLSDTDRACTRLALPSGPDQVTRQRSRMRESCTSGSVRGASTDRRLYSTLTPRELQRAMDRARTAALGELSRRGLASWAAPVRYENKAPAIVGIAV